MTRGTLTLAATLLLGLISLQGVPVEDNGVDPVASAETSSSQGITFRLVPTPDDPSADFTPDELELLEGLNRADVDHLRQWDSIVVPDRWDGTHLEYSPLPQRLAQLDTLPKALLVHQPSQVFGAYEDGRLVRWGPVSTGRQEHPTPVGRFFLTWRSEGRYSTVNPEWYMKWYYNFHNERGISFHQYALPGEPASHACVRLLERDARWIYQWGEGWTLDDRGWEVLEEGTSVWIVGEYDYDAPAPWRNAERPHPPVELEPSDLEI